MIRRLRTWLRYKRFYRAMVVDAGRRRQPLDSGARAYMKSRAWTAARVTEQKGRWRHGQR